LIAQFLSERRGPFDTQKESLFSTKEKFQKEVIPKGMEARVPLHDF